MERSVETDEMFAVTVVWSGHAARGWKLWLTTVDRRRICCSDDDADDPAFAAWLAQLPRWEPARLRVALERPGLHLVWRRSEAQRG